MQLYAGLDWASAEHAVCVIDERGNVVDRFTVAHTAEGLAELLRALRRVGKGEGIPIAIERPSGLVVDTLVEAGLTVVPIHPNVVKASRPRYGSSGAKSDPGDAYLLADLLRTDGHRFRSLRPSSDEMRALRSKVRTRDDLVTTRVQLTNRLRSLLESFWPGPIGLFSDLDSAISLNFLRRFPAPRDAARLSEKRVAAFLGASSYCGRKKPTDLLEHLHSAPTGLPSELEEEAKRTQVLSLVAILDVLVAQIAKLTAAVEHDVAELAMGQVIMSFPRAGRVNAAQILAEMGDDPARFDSADHFAAEAGVAPVTRASGKRSAVFCRFACNKRLRQALTNWADNSRHGSAWAAAIYQRARDRKCDHPHAVRVLARAWARTLWRCWSEGVPYDQDRHKAAALLAA